MTGSKRVGRGLGKLATISTVGAAGVLFLLGGGLAWAGPPNPTPSDANGNTAGGTLALFNTTGLDNTAFGQGALTSNTTGNYNAAFGDDALFTNTTGLYNTALGFFALSLNTGSANTAVGFQALLGNTTGEDNTASGVNALAHNTMGSNNTANGFQALLSNTTGDNNTGSGYSALVNNTSGSDNTASGFDALFNNTTGFQNTANGLEALFGNTTGFQNTAMGVMAGSQNDIGSDNTFVGYEADANAGSYTNGTALGHGAVLTASNSIVLGNRSISRIYANVTTITGISDRRRKKDITALDADLGLDFIEKLKPVSYRFNNGDETERYGFIAQDIEEALPAALRDTIETSEPEHGLALIERQNDADRTYRAAYGELFAPIVKSIQQQQQEITEARQQHADLRHALEALAGQFAALKGENDALRHSLAALKEQVTVAAR